MYFIIIFYLLVCWFSITQQYDQKNIRRRVYDALNVLMAMNIISKEKKEIRWLGLPTNSVQECRNLIKEKKQLSERIKHKTQRLHDLLLQVSCVHNFINFNFQFSVFTSRVVSFYNKLFVSWCTYLVIRLVQASGLDQHFPA